MLLALFVVLLMPPAGALVLSIVNAFCWPRPRGGSCAPLKVSLLIPARDEERVIAACVKAALASTAPLREVLVYDDGSSDRTPAILKALAADDARLRVLHGSSLPKGWVGKPHACHRLAAAARGEVLVFLDADVTLDEEGLGALLAEMRQRGADVLSAFPRQETGSLVEKVVLPLLHLSLTSFLPLVLVGRARDARVVAASGQMLAVTRRAYDAAGGFRAVKDALVDDMAFCRRAKRVGHKVVFVDGHRLARCRMYTSAREVFSGFCKNLYPGIGAHPLALVVVLTLYALCFLLPWLALVAGLFGSVTLLVPAGLGVGVNLVQRTLLAVRHGHSPLAVLLHPLAILVFFAIALSSWRWHARGAISWRGRSYSGQGRSRRGRRCASPARAA